MSFELSAFNGPLLFAGLLLTMLAAYTWRHRQVSGALPFAALLVSIAVWTFGYAFELGFASFTSKLFWARFQYLGISTLPLAWMAFVLRYTERGRWLRRLAWLALLVPLAINATLWVAPELVWSAAQLDASGSYPGLQLEHAAGFWVIVGYAYLLLLAGTVLLAIALYRAPRLTRAQIRTLLLGALAPWLGNALYSLHLNPLAPMDLTPFGFVITALAGAWALFGVRLLNIVPVAHSAVVRGMNDALVVLDNQNRVVEMNPAAESLLRSGAGEMIGRSFQPVLTDCPALASIIERGEQSRVELEIDRGQGERTCDIQLLNLTDRRGAVSGRMLVIRDITEQRLVRQALQQERDRARQYLDVARVMMVALDRAGRITMINPEGCRILGRDQDAILGHDWFEIAIPDAMRAELRQVFASLMAGDRLSDERLEHPVLTSFGSERLVSWHTAVLRDSASRIIGSLSSGEDITDQRAAEEALKSGQSIYRALFEQTSEAVFILDLDGIHFMANRQASTLLGYAADEFSELAFGDLIAPEGQQTHRKQQAALLAGEALPPREAFLVRKDGSRLAVEINATLVREPDGRPLHIQSIVRDITARKQEEDRRGYHLRIEQVLSQVSSLLIDPPELHSAIRRTLRETGRVLQVQTAALFQIDSGNSSIHQIAEWSSSDQELETPGYLIEGLDTTPYHWVLEQLSANQLIVIRNELSLPPVERAKMSQLGITAGLIAPVISHGDIYGLMAYANTDGERAWDSNEVNSVRTIAQILSRALERAETDRLLRDTLRRTSLLYAASRTMLDYESLNDSLSMAARILHREMGFSRADIALLGDDGSTLHRMASESDHEQPVDSEPVPVGRGIAGWVVQHNEPQVVPDVNADSRYLEVSGSTRSELCVPLQVGNQAIGVINVESDQVDAFGPEDLQLLTTLANNLAIQVERARLFAALEDRTRELEGANARLQELDRLKSEFLTNMSHEIRTPLNAIIGMTGLLQDTVLSQEQQDYVETLRSSGRTLLALINDILDFSKIESGKLVLEEHPFELRRCVQEAIELVAPAAQVKELGLETEIAADLPDTLVGDVTRLRQVLLNLLSNGIKFTARGGVRVTITGQLLEAGRYEFQFAVRDSGIGIAADQVDKLFQSFTQVDASTTRKYGGTGLGLVISRQLVEMMGGQIWLESDLGLGTTFFFTIRARVLDRKPLRDTGPLTPTAGRQEIDPTLGERQPLCILLAEDNPVNQKVALRMLQRLHYAADIANNGAEALSALRRRHYDVVLMDIQMPEMDGVEATERIRAGWPVDQQPRIVALTAHAMTGAREEYLASGMDDYISKPVQMNELIAALMRSWPPAAGRASTVDQSVLADLAEAMGEELVDLLHVFRQESIAQLQRMQSGLAEGQLAAVADAAHALRGSSASLGAVRLADLCREVEHGARDSQPIELGERVQSILRELTVVLRDLGV